jgi:hypothetical protein
MKRTIEITVSPIGDIQIDAIGFKGSGCEQATKVFEEALGVTAKKVKKPEYQQRSVDQVQQKAGQ